jgi:peptide/nickel transport system substrate-binding protein
MLRGFRWQLVALLMAVVLFVAALLARTSQTPPPTLTATPELQPAPPTLDVTEAAVEATASAIAATPLPLPTVDETESAASTPVPNTVISTVPDGVVTYREALVGEVQRLNPLLAPLNPVDADITSLIFEGLTRTNQYGEPEAALARDWVISSDGLEYVITLREDVLWQDGVPFSADDVMYTMSLLRSADFPGPAELGAFWRTIETEKLGTHLVRFRLTQPLGSFLDALRIGILPEHALRGTTAAQIATHPFNLTPIGTGPYQLEAVRTAADNRIDAVDLRVAPNFRLRPEAQTGYALERMRFRIYASFEEAVIALQNNEVDGLAAQNNSQRPALLGTTTNIHTKLEPTLGALIFNWASEETPFFREQRVRIALETGLDRTSLVERHLLNTAVQADSPILPGSWAYAANLEWPVPDPAAARQMLAPLAEQAATAVAESTEEAPSTTVFDFSILTPDTPALVNVANELAAQWAQYNIGVSVEAVELDQYHERLEAGDFDAALVELSLGDSADPDVYPFWHQGQYPDGTNYGGLNDSRISEVLERARRDPSGINRAQLYDRFQHDFVERAIAIPLYYPLYTYATAPNVTGVQLGFIGASSDRFRNIQEWSFAPQE